MKQICSLREEILKQREKKVETQNLISNLENIPPSQSQTYEEYFRPFLKSKIILFYFMIIFYFTHFNSIF